jgi:hypothetical protein
MEAARADIGRHDETPFSFRQNILENAAKIALAAREAKES